MWGVITHSLNVPVKIRARVETRVEESLVLCACVYFSHLLEQSEVKSFISATGLALLLAISRGRAMAELAACTVCLTCNAAGE